MKVDPSYELALGCMFRNLDFIAVGEADIVGVAPEGLPVVFHLSR